MTVTLTVATVLNVLLTRAIAHPVSSVQGRTLTVTGKGFSHGIGICKCSRVNRLTVAFGDLAGGLRRTRTAARNRQQGLSSILSCVASKIVTASHGKHIVLVGRPTTGVLGISHRAILSSPVISLLNLRRSCAFRRLLGRQSSIVLSCDDGSGALVLHTGFSIVRGRANFIGNLVAILRSVARRRGVSVRHHRFITGMSRRLEAPLAAVEDCLRTLTSNT